MKTKRLLALFCSFCFILILVALPFLTGCAPKEVTPPAPPPETPQAPPAEILKVGTILPMNNPWGVEADKCLRLLFDNLNATGGLEVQGKKYNVQLITYDDKYTLDGGKAAAERLVYQDKVKFIVGPLASSSVLGIIPVTEAEKVLLIHSSSTDQAFNLNYRYTFRSMPAKASVSAMYTFALKMNPNIKTQSIVASDDAFGHGYVDGGHACGKTFGITDVGDFFYTMQTTDFTDLATKAASLKPDFIFFVGTTGTTAGLTMKALYEAGWHGLVVSGSSPVWSEIKAVSTPEAMEGFCYQTRDPSVFPTGPAKDRPAAVELRKLYEAKYGTWNGVGAMWVNSYYLFVEAIKKANSLDPGRISAILGAAPISYPTPMGQCTTIRRPDLGITQYMDCLAEADFGVVKNMQEAYAASLTFAEVLAGVEMVFGYKGEWYTKE